MVRPYGRCEGGRGTVGGSGVVLNNCFLLKVFVALLCIFDFQYIQSIPQRPAMSHNVGTHTAWPG